MPERFQSSTRLTAFATYQAAVVQELLRTFQSSTRLTAFATQTAPPWGPEPSMFQSSTRLTAFATGSIIKGAIGKLLVSILYEADGLCDPGAPAGR